MKKILLFTLSLFLCLTGARADEGMWLLKLMEQQHLADSLRKAGLQLPPEALYSETSPSLRECVGIFGGGCTGEVVSPEGLVLTNHHCGFSFVHEMSSIGNDIMKDGYFAHSRAEELRTPESLTFTFVLAIEDVTEIVNAKAEELGADEYTAQSFRFLSPIEDELFEKSAYKDRKGVRSRIVPYFGGNQFYIFYEQTYSDIRLVANPPYNIGQFGGNSDNWIWPRQNADFAMFRIYADKDGQPAPYSEDNVPLKTTKFLPVSLKGMDEGDYTMIMGFPGSTSRYLTASEVELRCKSINSPYVITGNPLLHYYKNLMDQSDSLRLLLEDEYFSLGNAAKNFGGMNEAVEKIRLVEQKKAEEARFREFAKKSGKAEYVDVIDRIDRLCSVYADTIHDVMLGQSALTQHSYAVSAQVIDTYAEAVNEGKTDDLEILKAGLMAGVDQLRDADAEIDKGKLKILIPLFLKNHKLAAMPGFLADGKDWNALVDKAYAQTIFADSVRLAQALAENDITALQNDPLYIISKDLEDYFASITTGLPGYTAQRATLDKTYVRGLCEMYDWAKAPDANFTLRMTYGKVQDLKPRDAVRYDWRTVLDGMFEKESKTESDYFVNEKLRRLYEAKDFGRYAREDGKLPACFLSDNDITGGNSGSPVMNARGELIGLAFDGNIESLSSDLKFNPELQRCINVDIRYVLFLLDKYGDCKYVLDEMDIR